MEMILSQRMSELENASLIWLASSSGIENNLDRLYLGMVYLFCMKRLPAKLKSAKLIAFNRIAPASLFKLNKGSKAAVIVDKSGAPQLFIFDTFALLDVLSKIDEALVDRLSTEEYHSESVNPAGCLIDKIETKLPLNPDFILSLKNSIAEARKKGWIPFEKIEQELGLA